MSDDKIAEIRARHLRDDRWCYSPSPQMHDDRATLLAEVDRLRAENERLRDDAMRYRWLREQNRLQLVSQSIVWTRADGSKFRPSHCLSANDTRYGVYETLDETIDQARRSSGCAQS